MSEHQETSSTGPRTDDDGQLVRRALDGAPEAFDALVRRYQRKATSAALALLNNLDDALEIVQDAFLKTYEKLSSLSDPERFAPWLMRTVNNMALNRRRARTLRKAASLDAVDDDGDRQGLEPQGSSDDAPDLRAGEKDLRGLIASTLAELPETQRQALMLFSVQNLPQKQVAEELGCSVELVKWHVFTARKKLKEKLKDYL